MKLKKSFFFNKKILITGHTGFKGSWLSFWLSQLGGKIIGISNNFFTKPSIYDILNQKSKIKSYNKNIENFYDIKKIFFRHKPDLVFHLAAQSLVKKSYIHPRKTFYTNSIGTLNILECLKDANFNCSAVIITSDKSYKNIEIKRGYKENDLLGGKDPYSASKAAAEQIIHSYFESFLKNKKNINIAIARAGNVIGGGDWSDDRIIPDIVKSTIKNKVIKIRNPNSTRPWQHVLEILSGYILLMMNIHKSKKLNGNCFNFGPSNKKNLSVLDILILSKKIWPKIKWKNINIESFSESKLLSLNSNKAKKNLKWRDVFSSEEKIKLTLEWYKKYYSNKKQILEFSLSQLNKITIFLKKKLSVNI
jgi:CDP-glucose 4,6-dehydratase